VTTELVTALSGLAASFLSGLLGIGGGIVLTPLLLYVPALAGTAPIPVKIITGLTVVQAISGSALGALRHRSYGNVSTRLVLVMGPPGAIASLVGALLSRDSSDAVLLIIFAAFSFLTAVFLLLPPRTVDAPTEEVRFDMRLAIVLALVIGLFGGMVGIGAIAFILAALVYFLRVPARVAIGTSLGIGMFGAAAALVGKAATAQIDVPLAATVVVGALIGSPIGAWISVRTRTAVLLRILAVVVILAGVRILASAFSTAP